MKSLYTHFLPLGSRMPVGTGNLACGPIFATLCRTHTQNRSAHPSQPQHARNSNTGTHLSILPPIDKQQGPVGLSRGDRSAIIEHKAKHRIDALGHVELKRRYKEPDAGGVVREPGRQRAGRPLGRVEAGQVPAFAFAEEAALVQEAADLVWEAARCFFVIVSVV